MRAPAGIELLPDGTWDCGSIGGEWSPGGCGCSAGGSCGCGGTCGCGKGGKCGEGNPKGTCSNVVLPEIVDYNGELWAAPGQPAVAEHGRAPGNAAAWSILSGSGGGRTGEPTLCSDLCKTLHDMAVNACANPPTPKYGRAWSRWRNTCEQAVNAYRLFCGHDPNCPSVPSAPGDGRDRPITPTFETCMEKCGQIFDIKAFGKCFCCCWASLQSKQPPGWVNTIPDCPCEIRIPPPSIGQYPEGRFAGNRANQRYHPGATWELREDVSSGPGQQCTYDDKGKLITGGPGAGTPDISSPGTVSGFVDHWREDVQSFEACKNADMLECYLKHRPPNDAGGACPRHPPDAPIPSEGKCDCGELGGDSGSSGGQGY